MRTAFEKCNFLDYAGSMSTVLESPETELAETDRHAFNLAIWNKLVADPVLAALDYRIETDEHGQIIVSPPPAPSHGNKQSQISHLLYNLMEPDGRPVSECPISTERGVKAADVAWCSEGIWERVEGVSCFLECPEICIEILSPSNTKSEITEKKELYFDAGAKEVWICHKDGLMEFFLSDTADASPESGICQEFPNQIN